MTIADSTTKPKKAPTKKCLKQAPCEQQYLLGYRKIFHTSISRFLINNGMNENPAFSLHSLLLCNNQPKIFHAFNFLLQNSIK